MSYRKDRAKKLISELGEDERLGLMGELLAAPENKLAQLDLQVMSDYTAEAIERHKHFGQMQGLSTGYNSLDKLTKGLVGGEMTIVAGKTSHAKTTLAINIANHVALGGKTVLFVTLEMTHAEIASRFMFINGGADSDDYLTVSEMVVLQSATDLNWRNIDALIGRAREEMNVDLVIIDHLHYFTRELEHVAEDLGRITKELKKNAIIHKVPVILISHVRRTAKNTDAATIDDLRGSSYIAQDADVVLLVSRNPSAPTQLKVTIEKNRNRGFDYDNDHAYLTLDKIKIIEEVPDATVQVTQKPADPPAPKIPFS